MSFFIASAQAQTQAQVSQPNEWFSLGFMAVLFAIFYFIAIRPQRKRQKEHTQLVASLSKGDEVVTSAGMLGKVVGLDDNYVVLKVADNTQLKFQRLAISAVLPKGTIKEVG
jgi:preprotein translocase subunit YajC